MINNRLREANDSNVSDNDKAMITQAEAVKQLLELCSVQPGAKITIVVEHEHGHRAVAKLYDHAALVQSLHDSLDYFQSEML